MPDQNDFTPVVLSAVEKGWHVFPITPNAKAGGHGSTVASSDHAQVRSWWEAEPDANYGVACGPSGLYVVDLDVKHSDQGADGVDAWERLLAEHGLTGVRTFTVTTPSGGQHLYFRMPSGQALRNTQSVLAAGIDTRGVGGHVVGPGSTIDGQAYRVTHEAPILPLPGFVIEAVSRKARADSAQAQLVPVVGQAGQSGPAAPEVSERVAQLAAELAQAPHGQGNAEAARIAYMVGQYAGAGQIGRQEAVGVLLDALAGWTWASEGDARAMVHTIEAQVREGMREPREWIESADLWLEVDLTGSWVEEGEGPGRLESLLLDWNDLDILEPPVPLIEGVLDQGTIAVLAGKFGTYKSFLALDWAAHIASGADWNGHRVPEAGKVLYVAAEGASGVRKRSQAWTRAHQAIERGQLMVLPQALRLTVAADVLELSAMVGRLDLSLVILDTLHRSIPGIDEQSSSDMGGMLDLVHRLIEQHPKLCVLLVHHTGHAGERSRGSSSIEDDLDTSFVIKLGLDGKAETRDAATPRRLHHRKTKDGELLETRTLELELIEGTGSGVLRAPSELIGVGGLVEFIDPVDVVVRALDEAGQPLGLGRDAIYVWCQENDVKCSRDDSKEAARRRKERQI